jgi:hypothetical protein
MPLVPITVTHQRSKAAALSLSHEGVRRVQPERWRCVSSRACPRRRHRKRPEREFGAITPRRNSVDRSPACRARRTPARPRASRRAGERIGSYCRSADAPPRFSRPAPRGHAHVLSQDATTSISSSLDLSDRLRPHGTLSDLSAAGLTVVATAGLPVAHANPGVSQSEPNLRGPRRVVLVPVREDRFQ